MEANYYKISDRLYECLRKSVDLRRFTVEKIYGGKAYRIWGRGNDTNIYIRLELREIGVCVNFSTVELDERFRRQGLFRHIAACTYNIDGVAGIIIGGVCTQAMLNWCHTNGFVPLNEYYDFIKYTNKSGGKNS